MGRNDEFLEKPLPSSEESESACLGSVILDNKVMEKLVGVFVPDDCYNPANKYIYKAMLSLYEKGQTIDPFTVGDEMKLLGDGAALVNIGGVTRITNLTHGVPFNLNVDEWAKKVRVTSIVRKTIRINHAIERDLLAEDEDPAEVLGRAETRILQLNSAINGDRATESLGFTSAREIVPTIREQFERYHAGEVTGVQTGMAKLDDMLDGGGMQKKATYVVAGLEKSGKTSLALDWVEDIVTQQDLAALIVTLEMSKETLLKRLYAKHKGIPYYFFRPGFHDSNGNNAYTRAMQGLEEFEKYPFHIADSIHKMSQIKRYCGRMVEKGHKKGNKEIGVIMLDYLQIINPDQPIANDQARVSLVSREIKQMASELDVPVIVMSNMNRTKLSDEGTEPDTQNLRDSQQIAFDAEPVMFVHNPAYVPGKPYERRDITDMTLILSRQRNGPTGRIPLKFIGPFMQFMTEEQFNRHVGATSGDRNLPLSRGEMNEREKGQENLWDEDDEVWGDSK